MRIAVAAAVGVLSVTAVAHAQTPATSFAVLANRVTAGQTVSVTIESGEVISGTLASVSDSSLTLTQPTRTLLATDVQLVTGSRTFKQRGALVGFGVAFAIGAAAGLSLPDCRDTIGPCSKGLTSVLGGGGVLGLVGAGVGTAAGALVHAERVLYSRARRVSTRNALEPRLLRTGVGLEMKFRW